MVVAGGCVGSGKTPRTDGIEPLPDGMTVVATSSNGCREGESGFDYRFVVVGPADTTAHRALRRTPPDEGLRPHGARRRRRWPHHR